ncbi:MAG: hypothetical protein ACK4NC_00950 [Candidatus Gracilibacteria bacterium]
MKFKNLQYYISRFSYLLLIAAMLPMQFTHAELTPEANEWINQTTNQQISVGMLPGYEGNIFNFLNKIIRSSVSIALTLAVLMLVLAGFAAVQAKDSAKEDYFTKVKNVSTGVAIILLSYLIIAGLYSLFFAI